MVSNDFKTAQKVVGVKQAIKALEKNTAKLVIVAEDADEKVIKPLVDLCTEKNVPYEKAESMKELGRMCGIEVGAAAIALLA